ncbi:MAG: GNAT family acetyltransferase [Planctomycetales bacterium]|nr:GNAT family acetyltransferase [Planctomycetales bacterium]
MIDDVQIRSFASADAERVIEFWRENLPAQQPWNEPRAALVRKLYSADQLVLVAELNDRIIATTMAGYDGVRGWIYAVAVAPVWRRRGIGQRMVAEAEQCLRSRGCIKVNLQVRGDNPDVIAFYLHCGYAIEGRTSFGKVLEMTAIDRLESCAEPVEAVPTIPIHNGLVLTPIRMSDRNAYVTRLNATRVYHENGATLPFPYLEIDAEQWIYRALRESLERDQSRNWAIRNAQGELVGGVGFMGLQVGDKAEIGYWLAEHLWGRGAMTAVVQSVCDFGFSAYDLQKIFGQVFSNNIGSARVLEKAGFTLEGTLRAHFRRDGKGRDVLVYGKLRGE